MFDAWKGAYSFSEIPWIIFEILKLKPGFSLVRNFPRDAENVLVIIVLELCHKLLNNHHYNGNMSSVMRFRPWG